ncbi:MAG: DUF4124 domain-containing protein [Betaproteobacteria bacterium]|nr:DUF4124 domain-containing protein [Betaproteobacteria bacterium]
MRVAWFLFLSLWGAAAAAQTMYKCTDAQRRITYSNETCEKQGLKDAGPVADRVTSMPFTAPSKPAARKDSARAPAPGDKEDVDAGRGGAKIKPVVPLLEKLLK